MSTSSSASASRQALDLLDAGKSRAEINEACGAVLGVADASLDVAEGEIFVLMGLSGSGKSTLLRAVNGLNKVARGSVQVSVGGRTTDVASCSAADLRRLRQGDVAMVFQQFALLPWRTVEENVGLGLELAGMPEASASSGCASNWSLSGWTSGPGGMRTSCQAACSSASALRAPLPRKPRSF
jgi:glycine betaine/proline transport system ATP-binding protein